MAPPPPPSSIAAASSLTSTTSISSMAKDVPSLQKDFTEFWVAATRVVRLKRGQIDIDIAKKVSQLMKAILSAAHRGQQNGLPQGRKDKRQVSLRVYGLLIKGACVLFSRKADLVLKRCDAVMAKFRETLRSTKGIAGDEDEERGPAAAAAKKRKKGKQRKRKVAQDDQDADPSPEEAGSDGAERRVRRRAGSDHPPSVGDSVTTRPAETPPSEGNGAAEDDDGRRRNEEGLIESGEVVGNSQLPIMTSAELRELSISSEGGGAGDGPPPPSLPDELMGPPPTPSAHDDPPSVPGSPPAPSPGPQQPTASSVSTAVRRPRAKRRAAGSSGRKRRRLDRQVYISEADYDQWAQNDEPITRTREMQWRPADYVRNAPSLTRLDFLGPRLTRSIEEGGRLLLGVLGGGGGGQPPITPNEDMEVDELRDQPDAVQLEETFLDPPTPLDASVMDGRKERVSLLSDVFARTPQSSPSEPDTPRSQQHSLSGRHQQPESAKFPPTHLSTET
ncbi:hypothetical protein FOZ62_000505, partial [Perkinsus olseni]